MASHDCFFGDCEDEAALSGSFFGACEDEAAPVADLGLPRLPFGSCVLSGSCSFSSCFLTALLSAAVSDFVGDVWAFYSFYFSFHICRIRW